MVLKARPTVQPNISATNYDLSCLEPNLCQIILAQITIFFHFYILQQNNFVYLQYLICALTLNISV